MFKSLLVLILLIFENISKESSATDEIVLELRLGLPNQYSLPLHDFDHERLLNKLPIVPLHVSSIQNGIRRTRISNHPEIEELIENPESRKPKRRKNKPLSEMDEETLQNYRNRRRENAKRQRLKIRLNAKKYEDFKIRARGFSQKSYLKLKQNSKLHQERKDSKKLYMRELRAKRKLEKEKNSATGTGTET